MQLSWNSEPDSPPAYSATENEPIQSKASSRKPLNIVVISVLGFILASFFGYHFHELYNATHYKNWRKELEDAAQRRKQLVWGDFTPAARCLRYGTREYTATLSNVPASLDGLVECGKKAITFRGKTILPSSCTVAPGSCGNITGHWDIDFDEPACTPWWDSLSDKGCDTNKGLHRYEARLMDLHSSEDWQTLCKTTPVTVKGVHYSGASSCLDLGIWGKYGIWFVEDSHCR